MQVSQLIMFLGEGKQLTHPAETRARTPARFVASNIMRVISAESSTTTEPNLDQQVSKVVEKYRRISAHPMYTGASPASKNAFRSSSGLYEVAKSRK